MMDKQQQNEHLARWAREIAIPQMVKMKEVLEEATTLMMSNIGPQQRIFMVKPLPWWKRIWRRR